MQDITKYHVKWSTCTCTSTKNDVYAETNIDQTTGISGLSSTSDYSNHG